MSKDVQSKLDDADMQAVPGALLRAAKRAREIARRTGTRVIVVKDGELRALDPDDPELDAEPRDLD